MRPAAVFDLDDCVANLRDLHQDIVAQLTGRHVTWHQWLTYDVWSQFGLNPDRVKQALVDQRVIERLEPEPGARELLEAARESGLHTVICTARAWHPEGDALTRRWLRDHDLVVDDLHVLELTASKAVAVEQYPTVLYQLDDAPKHIHEAQDRGFVSHPCIIDRPWNRQHDRFDRIFHLGELADRIVSDCHRRTAAY